MGVQSKVIFLRLSLCLAQTATYSKVGVSELLNPGSQAFADSERMWMWLEVGKKFLHDEDNVDGKWKERKRRLRPELNAWRPA